MSSEKVKPTISIKDFSENFLSLSVPERMKGIVEFNDNTFRYFGFQFDNDLSIYSHFDSPKYNIVFEDVDFNSIHLHENAFEKLLIFKNCKFSDNFEIRGGRLHVCHIIKCVFEKNIILNYFRHPLQFLLFQDCQISDGIELYEINRIESISFTGKTISDGTIQINKCHVSLVQIKELVFNKIHFFGRIDSIHVLQSIGEQLIFLSETNRLYISNLKINEEISFGSEQIREVRIEDLKGQGTCLIENNLIDDFDLVNSHINKVSMYRLIYQKPFNFRKSSVNELKFEDIKGMSNLIKFEETHINPNGLLTIKKSNLGEMLFVKCDFSECRLEFENSRIQNVFLPQTDFPNKYNSLNNDKFSYYQAQLFFGQLHSAYQKQGDNIRAIDCLSNELAAHSSAIDWFKKTYCKWIKMHVWSLNFTKLSLFLNKVSNNYGLSWARGVAFTFIVGLLFFHLVVIFTQEYKLSFNLCLTGPFFKFLNPLRHFEVTDIFSSKATVSGAGYVADFFGRIMISYGYYQTIQAFRKYGRK